MMSVFAMSSIDRNLVIDTRAGLRELEALGEVNLVAPNEIEK